MTEYNDLPNRVTIGTLLGLPDEALQCGIMAKKRDMTMADWLRWCVEQAEGFSFTDVGRSGTLDRSRARLIVLPRKLAGLPDDAWNRLMQHEITVVKKRYGIGADGKSYTLQQIADQLHLSRERVRQIQKRAIEKLSEYLE